jgi:hypothetical protein
MPEISVGKDKLNRSEFVFTPLPGELASDSRELNFRVAQASSLIKSARLEKDDHPRQVLIEKAIDRLSFLPATASEPIVQALLNQEEGTTLIFKYKGKTMADGFQIESLVRPQKT